MGVIVYLSTSGRSTNPVIPLWWDIVTVAVFSLVIYYWAMRSRLPTEEIEEMVNEVVPARGGGPARCRRTDPG